MSWWDYGYQIAGMANRTTLVDNNTWNNSHIALVSRIHADSVKLVALICAPSSGRNGVWHHCEAHKEELWEINLLPPDSQNRD